MKPGRELDALVAEKVMGWAKTNLKDWDQAFKDEFGFLWAEPGHGYFKGFHTLPHYSTDIKAAWEVVEKMGTRFIHLSPALEGGWSCAIQYNEARFPFVNLIGKTAPEAICRAALKAVGHD